MDRRSFIADMLAAPVAAQLAPIIPHMPAAPSVINRELLAAKIDAILADMAFKATSPPLFVHPSQFVRFVVAGFPAGGMSIIETIPIDDADLYIDAS